MGIYIRGMEMPECCGYCPFEHKKYCMAKPSLMVESADRHPRCPLVPVPQHRRLIDADELFKEMERKGWFDNADRDKAEDLVLDAPTIIPASDKDTNVLGKEEGE